MAFIDGSSFSHETMPNSTATDYELAGRLPSQSFLDIRSAAKARRRHRSNLEKYYSYRGVNTGQLGQLHHRYPENIFAPQTLPFNTPVGPMTKRDLYQEAQRWPRPPTHHRKEPDKVRGIVSARKEKRRRDRRHAHEALADEVEEAQDPMFMAYATGEGKEWDLGPHVFRQCDVCWPELAGWYVDNEMEGVGGEVEVGLEREWKVWLSDAKWNGERIQGGKVGFAGRGMVGDVFLMGGEDWRIWPHWAWGESEGEWEEDWESGNESEDEGHIDEAIEEDLVSEASSWDNVLRCEDDGNGVGGNWKVLSSCSSWSEVSK